MFNGSVQRVTADPQARRTNGLANVTPTPGDLRIPMLTLHTLGDLFVPFQWVEGGVKPAGDAVLDAAEVGKPNFGCTHTDKARRGCGTRCRHWPS